MVELDIEELLIGVMEFEKPVVRGSWRIGSMLLLDEPDVLTFTSVGIADRLVYRVGDVNEISIEDLFNAGMDNTTPILRDPVNAGGCAEIKLGGQTPLIGDDLHLIDFTENAKTHIVNIVNGLIRSWGIHDEGTYPIIPNQHVIVIENGTVKSWTITTGGMRIQKGHSIDILRGLVESWGIV
jgi:hypothetical protein